MLLPSPILTICAGNLCRSPFAEAYLRQRFEAAGVAAEAFSRGLLTLPNQHPPKEAQQVASEFNIDLASHVSQPLLGTDLDRAGIVFVMDTGQRQHISKTRPACIGKVFLLSQPSGGEPIGDPMGRDEDVFRQVYTRIAAEVDAWMQRFGVHPD